MRWFVCLTLLALSAGVAHADDTARRVRVALALAGETPPAAREDRDRVRRVCTALGVPCDCGDCDGRPGCPACPAPTATPTPPAPAVSRPAWTGQTLELWQLPDGSIVSYPRGATGRGYYMAYPGGCPGGTCPTPR